MGVKGWSGGGQLGGGVKGWGGQGVVASRVWWGQGVVGSRRWGDGRWCRSRDGGGLDVVEV